MHRHCLAVLAAGAAAAWGQTLPRGIGKETVQTACFDLKTEHFRTWPIPSCSGVNKVALVEIAK